MQLKRKESKKICRSRFIVIGSLLILFGICLISFDILSNKNLDILEEQAIIEYYNQEEIIHNEDLKVDDSIITVKENKKSKIEYIGILSIPKINLKRGLVDPNSYLNNVQYNIQILNNSDMPDVLYGNVIIAGHSGSGRIAYFKNLDKLENNDEVIIDYKNKTYIYSVISKYEINKSGEVNIIRNRLESTLTLITCKHNTNKQIVVICNLKSEK